MSFVTSREMLLDAQKGGYAVGAFNVENMEMVKAVIAAAEELRAPCDAPDKRRLPSSTHRLRRMWGSSGRRRRGLRFRWRFIWIMEAALSWR